jgi:hypothetical protein
MIEQKSYFWESIKKRYESEILSVYSINGFPSIESHILDIMNDTARGEGSIDNTELVSYNHCDNNISTNSKKKYFSERDYEKHYNETIGPLTSNKSIPDGAIVVDDVIHLLSVFRISNNIVEKYICRKVQKLIQVALSEYNQITSLFYKKFPENKIKSIELYFYIFIPEITKVNKVKNVIKKIHRIINCCTPDFVNIHYNIFQTFGDIEKLFWYSSCGICIYIFPRTCKKSKLKNIQDIKNVLIMFFSKEITEFILADTFFFDI